MIETQTLEQPDIDEVPAAEQVTLEEPEVDARHGWMKASYEEVVALAHNLNNAKNPDWIFSDVSIHDKAQQKLLFINGYKPDYENPGNDEKNGIMYWKISREDHDMKYKAEVSKRNLNQKKMLTYEGTTGGVKAKPKVNEEMFNEAWSRVAATEEEFNSEGVSIMKVFSQIDTGQ